MEDLRGREFTDVFVPDFGVRGDIIRHHVDALLAVEVDDADAVFSKPLNAALEVAAFADDEGSDVELADEAAAIPAGGEGGDHHEVAVVALAAGAAECVGFTVDGGVTLLDAAIVASTDEFSGLRE